MVYFLHSSKLNCNLCLQSAESYSQYFHQFIHYLPDILNNIVLIGVLVCWLSFRGGSSVAWYLWNWRRRRFFPTEWWRGWRWCIICPSSVPTNFICLFQVSVRDGNFALGCSRHLISWIQYISSPASFIQSFWVPFQG